ncbi:MAG: hypothetical protein WC030_01650 [Candidatus Paceibacterota bacterium]
MKKHFSFLSALIFAAVALSFVSTPTVRAADEMPAPCPEGSAFCPLAPIPGLTEAGGATTVIESQNLASFFNQLYIYLIGLAAAAAVVQIIWGGLEISTKDSVSKQSDGKARIQQALFGLVLVLSPVLVFSIINPSILNLSLNLQPLDTATKAPDKTPRADGSSCQENSDCSSRVCRPNSALSSDLGKTCVHYERGQECTYDYQCASNECDTSTIPGTCRDRSVEDSLVLDGGACTKNLECTSTVCDASTNKCSALGDFPPETVCTRNAQCRSQKCSLHADGKFRCNK